MHSICCISGGWIEPRPDSRLITKSREQSFHDFIKLGVDIDVDCFRGGLERIELRSQQRRRHVAVLTCSEPLGDEIEIATQMDDDKSWNASAEDFPVACAQCRAGEHNRFAAGGSVPEQCIEPLKPGLTIFIVERQTCSHLVDIGRGMVVIRIHKSRAQMLCECLAYAGFAATRYAHDQNR